MSKRNNRRPQQVQSRSAAAAMTTAAVATATAPIKSIFNDVDDAPTLRQTPELEALAAQAPLTAGTTHYAVGADFTTEKVPMEPMVTVGTDPRITVYVGKPVALCRTTIEAIPGVITAVRPGPDNEVMVDIRATTHSQSSTWISEKKGRAWLEIERETVFENVSFFDPTYGLVRKPEILPDQYTATGQPAMTDSLVKTTRRIRRAPQIAGGLIPGKWFDPELWAWRLKLILGPRKGSVPGEVIAGKEEVTPPFSTYADCYHRWWKETYRKSGKLRGRWDRIVFEAEQRA
jgi:hypothetical protein